MKADLGRYARSQGGYTLIELIVASAISLFVLTGLTSVVLTSWRAGAIATSRVEASAQIRNFQFRAYDDFALSGAPVISSCGANDPPPCSITLSGLKASNSEPPVLTRFTVIYFWDGTNVDRIVGSDVRHAATNVTAFSASVSGETVGVSMTVTMPVFAEMPYAETQKLRFYPRVNPT
jgi:prepilin-type N-terminal cleavage/methylation domain-containing protein